MKKALFFCSCLFLSWALNAKDNYATNPISQNLNNKPLFFIENKGQITNQDFQPRTDVQLQLKTSFGMTVFIGEGAIHYQFAKAIDSLEPSLSTEDFRHEIAAPITKNYTLYRMDVTLIGANKKAAFYTEDQQDYTEHLYNIGTSPKGAIANAYNKVTYKDIYPNIDWVLYTKNHVLKHEFIVRPGGNPADIQLQYNGATHLQLNKNGSLSATTPLGTIEEFAPVTYTLNGKQVASQFVLQDNVLSYNLGNYEGTLVIDPSVSWATYCGDSGNDRGRNVVSDALGNSYMVGETQSVNNIATTGAFQTTYGGGNYDAFLIKFNSSGSRVWATYYGGTGLDYGFGIAMDNNFHIYCSGQTGSTTNIATNAAYQTTYGGSFDAFLVAFDTAGNRLFGTYYGGAGLDQGYGVVADKNGHIYLSGASNSPSNIASTNAYQTFNSGTNYDAYLVQFDAAGNRQWATYYGGSANEFGIGLAADSIGNVFLTGYTGSTSGIATQNAHQPVYGGGGYDVFLVKFSPVGTIQWGSYIGGNSSDYGEAIATDHNGNVYLTGYTNSFSGIASATAYQPNIHTGSEEAFIMKFTNNGTQVWGTYFGGNGDDEGYSIQMDRLGKIWVSGSTGSSSAIATNDASQQVYGGGNSDAFLASFSPSGSLEWSSYLGGSAEDKSYGLAIGANNQVVMTGYTYSTSNLATATAYQPLFGGGLIDAFVAVYAQNNMPIADSIIGPHQLCVGNTIKLINAVPNGIWYVADTTIATINALGILTAHQAGNVLVGYVVANNWGADTAFKWMTVHYFSFANDTHILPLGATTFCINSQVSLQAPATFSYLWSNGDTTQNTTVSTQGYYFVQLTDSQGCIAVSDTVLITPKPFPSAIKIKINGATSVCEPNTVFIIPDMPLGSTSGFSYQWNKQGVPLIGATDSTYAALASGSYTLTVSGGPNCTKSSSSKTVTVKSKPTASYTLLGDTTICLGAYTTLTAPTILNYTYTWLKDGFSAGGGTSKTVKLAGTYTLIAKLNGCNDTATNPIDIIVNPLPFAAIAATTSATFCTGDSCLLAATPVTALNYEWHLGSVVMATSSLPNLKVGQVGTYKVIVTDTNGCVSKISSSSVKTKINAIPNASITVLGSTILASNGSVKLKAVPASGVAWQWFKDGVLINGATAYQYLATSGGNYSVAITKLGCTGVSLPITVTQTFPKSDDNSATLMDGEFILSAYPNPFSEILTLQIEGSEPIAMGNLEVIDVLGNIIASRVVLPDSVEGTNYTGFVKLSRTGDNSHNCQLSTTNWPSGVYFLRYKNSEGRVGTLKVVKE